MKDKRFITRFFISTAAAAFAFAGTAGIMNGSAGTSDPVRPMLNLTSGEIVDPATAPEVTKFNNATAREFADMVFGEAEETPDLNEFLSRFTCSACGKRCLLTSPRCSKGRGSQEKAVVIYQEMFPEVELVYSMYLDDELFYFNL